MLLHHFKRGITFMTSCFLSLTVKCFQKWCLPLTLLHSERPKLYGVLAFLSAIGLKERICFFKKLTPTDKGGKNENGRVVSLKGVLIHHNRYFWVG